MAELIRCSFCQQGFIPVLLTEQKYCTRVCASKMNAKAELKEVERRLDDLLKWAWETQKRNYGKIKDVRESGLL